MLTLSLVATVPIWLALLGRGSMLDAGLEVALGGL